MSISYRQMVKDFVSWLVPRRTRSPRRPIPLRLTIYHFDLAGVTTPEELRNVFAEHFELPVDYREMWRPLYVALREQVQPYDGVLAIFEGWAAFAARMPRHANRIKYAFGYGYRKNIASHGRIIAHFE